MFTLYKDENDDRFTWNDVEGVKKGRTNLGEIMPVFVYRMFQYTLKDELQERFGKEAADDIFRKAGKRAGMEFAAHVLDLTLPLYPFIAHLQAVLEENRIGIMRVEKFDQETGEAVLTIAEDLDCSGLPVTGETVCCYDEGFLAGVLKQYTKKDYVVTEVDCWATGARICRFEANVMPADEMGGESYE